MLAKAGHCRQGQRSLPKGGREGPPPLVPRPTPPLSPSPHPFPQDHDPSLRPLLFPQRPHSQPSQSRAGEPACPTWSGGGVESTRPVSLSPGSPTRAGEGTHAPHSCLCGSYPDAAPAGGSTLEPQPSHGKSRTDSCGEPAQTLHLPWGVGEAGTWAGSCSRALRILGS